MTIRRTTISALGLLPVSYLYLCAIDVRKQLFRSFLSSAQSIAA